MTKSLIYSISFHALMICLTILSLPFMTRQPIDLPPIVSVELIQISDKTNIPYAPKARKIIEEAKKEEELLAAEQAKVDAMPNGPKKMLKQKALKALAYKAEQKKKEVEALKEYEEEREQAAEEKAEKIVEVESDHRHI